MQVSCCLAGCPTRLGRLGVRIPSSVFRPNEGSAKHTSPFRFWLYVRLGVADLARSHGRHVRYPARTHVWFGACRCATAQQPVFQTLSPYRALLPCPSLPSAWREPSTAAVMFEAFPQISFSKRALMLDIESRSKLIYLLEFCKVSEVFCLSGLGRWSQVVQLFKSF